MPRRWFAVFATLLDVFLPAIYGPSWTPWLRWALTGCLVVVLVVVVYLVRAMVGMVLVVGMPASVL